MFGPCSEKVEGRLEAGLEDIGCRIGTGLNHVRDIKRILYSCQNMVSIIFGDHWKHV